MKTIIAGGRNYHFTKDDRVFLEGIQDSITTVVTGGASGADEDAHEWARGKRIHTAVFCADWRTHGLAAGPIRNREMAEYSAPDGQCILFPGGRGTNSMARCAADAGLKIIDRRNTTT